jgi:hypothetical protein
VRGVPDLVEGDARRSKPGVLLRLEDRDHRVWDLSAILPD